MWLDIRKQALSGFHTSLAGSLATLRDYIRSVTTLFPSTAAVPYPVVDFTGGGSGKPDQPSVNARVNYIILWQGPDSIGCESGIYTDGYEHGWSLSRLLWPWH